MLRALQIYILLIIVVVIIRPHRSRSTAAYIFSAIVVKLSRGRSVGPYVRTCMRRPTLWKNGGSDPDAVWHHRSDGSRDEAGSGVWRSVHGKGNFCGRIWGAQL